MSTPQKQQKKKKKGRAPAHQNTFAFRHNPKSKKTAAILETPIQGVCRRCRDKLEWRKRYRKYKPLRQPSKCNLCDRRNVLVPTTPFARSAPRNRPPRGGCWRSGRMRIITVERKSRKREKPQQTTTTIDVEEHRASRNHQQQQHQQQHDSTAHSRLRRVRQGTRFARRHDDADDNADGDSRWRGRQTAATARAPSFGTKAGGGGGSAYCWQNEE